MRDNISPSFECGAWTTWHFCHIKAGRNAVLQRLFRTLTIKRKQEQEMSFGCIKRPARFIFEHCNLCKQTWRDKAVWYRWSNNGFITHLRQTWGHLMHTGIGAGIRGYLLHIKMSSGGKKKASQRVSVQCGHLSILCPYSYCWLCYCVSHDSAEFSSHSSIVRIQSLIMSRCG